MLDFNDNFLDVLAILHFFFIGFIVIACFFLVSKLASFFLLFLVPTSARSAASFFILKTFLRDCAGILIFILRMYILLFRVNIYDLLDDLHDSYYIFFTDFSEEGDNALAFVISTFDLNVDAGGEGPWAENSLYWNDCFLVYALAVLQFFFFFLLLVENALRLLLGAYLFYLIIFELYMVFFRFREDIFIITKLLQNQP